jgi:hypothetical protein
MRKAGGRAAARRVVRMMTVAGAVMSAVLSSLHPQGLIFVAS